MRIRQESPGSELRGCFFCKTTMEIQGKWKNGSVRKKETRPFLSNKKYPFGEGRIFLLLVFKILVPSWEEGKYEDSLKDSLVFRFFFFK